MVEAKGGRERLHEVTTFLMESHDRRMVAFWAFPNWAWGWQDLSGTPFGDSVSMVDAGTMTIRSMRGPCGEWDCRVRTSKMENLGPFYAAQLIYLFETRFCQPELKRCGREKVDGKQMRFLEVEKGPLRFVYYLPDKSDLPAIIVQWKAPSKLTISETTNHSWHPTANGGETGDPLE